MINGQQQGIAKGQTNPIKRTLEVNKEQAPLDVSGAILKVGMAIGQDGLTKRYARQFKETQTGVLQGSQSFEQIMEVDKENPIWNSLVNQGRIDGARVAQSVNMKLAFREELETSLNEYVGLAPEDFSNVMDTKAKNYLTGDNETDRAFMDATLLDRRDVLVQQQKLNRDFLKGNQAKAITTLVNTAGYTSSPQGMEQAVDVVVGGLRDDDGVISSSVTKELKNQILIGNTGLADALMASGKLPPETYKEINKALKDQNLIEFNKGSEVYFRAVEDGMVDLERMAKDPSIQTEEIQAKFDELDSTLNFKPSDYGKVTKLIALHPELVKNYIKPRTFAQKEAANEVVADIHNSLKQQDISSGYALKMVEFNRSDGSITDAQALSLIKKIKATSFESSLAKEDKKARKELSKIDSLDEQLANIQSNKGLTVKQKAGLSEDVKQQWINDNGKLIKQVTVTDSLRDLEAIAERLIPDSPHHERMDKLIADREANIEVIGKIAVGKPSSKTALVTKDQKAIGHHMLDNDTMINIEQRTRVINATGISEASKDEVQVILSSERSSEPLTENQLVILGDLKVYVEAYGSASAMTRFGLKSKEGQALISAITRHGNPDAAMNGFYISQENKSIKPNEYPSQSKANRSRFIKSNSKKGKQQGILASDTYEEIKELNPDLTSDQIVDLAEADVKENTVGGIIGMTEEILSVTTYTKYLKDPNETIIEGFKNQLHSKGMSEDVVDSLEVEVSVDGDNFRFDYGSDEIGYQTVYISKEAVDNEMEGSEEYQDILKEDQKKQDELNNNLAGNHESGFDKMLKILTNPMGDHR